MLSDVYVLPGVPAEMQACFDAIADRFAGQPIRQERQVYALAESDLVGTLRAFEARFGDVSIGSYPSFGDGRSEVALVLKSRDEASLQAAAAWLAAAVAAL